jgi:hypothetical protein
MKRQKPNKKERLHKKCRRDKRYVNIKIEKIKKINKKYE